MRAPRPAGWRPAGFGRPGTGVSVPTSLSEGDGAGDHVPRRCVSLHAGETAPVSVYFCYFCCPLVCTLVRAMRHTTGAGGTGAARPPGRMSPRPPVSDFSQRTPYSEGAPSRGEGLPPESSRVWEGETPRPPEGEGGARGEPAGCSVFRYRETCEPGG